MQHSQYKPAAVHAKSALDIGPQKLVTAARKVMQFYALCRYAAGATIQILLFGILAIEIKRKAPTAHTMLEIIRARWGTLAHIVRTLTTSYDEQALH